MDIIQDDTFDILNQRTWDGYDWFLYCFCNVLLGTLCLCFGWHAHKKCTRDQYVPEDDIQQFSTPISISQHGSDAKKYTFAGFNLFGENIEGEDLRAARQKHQQQLPSQTLHTPTLTAPSPNSLRQSRHSSVASEQELATLREMSTIRESMSGNTAVHIRGNSSTVIVAMPSPDIKPSPILIHDPVPLMANIDPTQRDSLPRILMPTKSSKIIPSYNVDGLVTTPQTVKTPDSMEPSQSHLSIEVLRQYSNSTQDAAQHTIISGDREPVAAMKKSASNSKTLQSLKPLGVIEEELSVQFEIGENTPSESDTDLKRPRLDLQQASSHNFPDFEREMTPDYVSESDDVNTHQAQ
eukprot:200572_1